MDFPALRNASATPVVIDSLEPLAAEGARLLLARSRDGAEGLAPASERLDYLWPILRQRVIPYFLGRDARDLPELVEGVFLHQSNYKLAGIAFWCCVGWVEGAVLDLLGRLAGKPVHALLGPQVRDSVEVYVSSMRRDTTPQQEVDWIAPRIAQAGARAAKIKVGGRMSGNADAMPGRSERLVRLMRETFGPDFTLYADANGSYDADHAIAVGRMLESYGVAFFEEPCPWEDYRDTQRVADSLELPIAGGEQDSCWYRFRDMIEARTVDIVQPDLNYNGGILRTLRVAGLAAEHGMLVTPHAPRSDENWLTLLHFAACTPNLGRFAEFNAAHVGRRSHCRPAIEVRDGCVAIPSDPGLGVTWDPDLLTRLKPVGE